MPFRFLSFRGRALLGLAAPILSILLAAPARAEVPAPAEILPPGESRERPIAAGETHFWRVVVAPGTNLLVTVEQQSIDLVVEARGPESRKPIMVDGGNDRWGPEVLLLENASEVRIEIRPRDKSVWPGRYTLRTESLPAAGDARRDAFALMSRAGQEALPDTPEASRRAVATYRQALAAWRSLGDRAWEAESLTCLAILEAEASELQPATEDFLAALPLWRELGKSYREAEALNRLGLIYKDTQGVEKAREPLKSALSLWHDLEMRFDEAATQTNLCLLDQTRGALPEALACYQENLTFFQGLGARNQEALLRNNIGGIYDSLGEPDNALAWYEQALAAWRALGDPRKEAATLNNMAVVHRALGEWQEALRLYGEVREILKPLGDLSIEAKVLNNIALRLQQPGAGRTSSALRRGCPEAAPERKRSLGRDHDPEQPRIRLAQARRSEEGARTAPAGPRSGHVPGRCRTTSDQSVASRRDPSR